MAKLNIEIDIPDQMVPELVDALNWAWNRGGQEPLTASQLRERIRRKVVEDLKGVYLEHKRRQSASNINIT